MNKCISMFFNMTFMRLLQDTAGLVKLWDITTGVVIENYGKVLFILFGTAYLEFVLSITRKTKEEINSLSLTCYLNLR